MTNNYDIPKMLYNDKQAHVGDMFVGILWGYKPGTKSGFAVKKMDPNHGSSTLWKKRMGWIEVVHRSDMVWDRG